MSYADRAKEYRKNSGAFRFPAGEYSTRLKGWEFKLSRNKNPMFVLEWKVLDKGDCRNKIMKDRFIISVQAEWQFDAFLVLLEDFGIDLNGLDDQDPQFQDIQDALDFIEGKAPTVKVELTPQEEDPRYYRLRYLEVPKVGEGTVTSAATYPADYEDPADYENPAEPEEVEELQPPPAQTRKPTTTTAKTTAATGIPAKKKPWER